jgi:hypothetical protein
VLCGLVAALVAQLPGPKPRAQDALRPGKPQVYHAPRAMRLTTHVRRQVDETVDAFVRTAVLRQDLARSWQLASPGMRASASRSDWLRGELPVFPFPADPQRTAWDVDYADSSEVALNVTLVPRHGAHTQPEVFGVSLRPVGRGERRRWLVDSWYPRGPMARPEPPAEASQQPTEPTPAEAAELRRVTEGQIDRIWWLIPAGALALIVLAPLAAFGVVRGRAAVARRRAT